VLTQAIFVEARAPQVRFDHADMRQCLLIRAICQQASFANVRLDEADASHADLREADLRGASMYRTRLHGVHDEGAAYSDRLRALESDEPLLAAERWQPRVISTQ
jgi:uncharacterized protein YjbI with pentapeptide repeats